MSGAPDVSIVVVTFDSGRFLSAALERAQAQKGIRSELIVVDNASHDDSRRIAANTGARVIALPGNRGFAGGANAGIEASSGRYVLTLNPDCRLEEDFCARLAERLDREDARDVGSASGKLFRAEGEMLEPMRLMDSTGIYFTTWGRHLDRDSGRLPGRSASKEGEIAGVSGAAGFYRRSALESVRISTGYFDEDFFIYREDADLALRLRRAGWRCLYLPQAIGYHRRANLPDRRREIGKIANYHSVKNRFLLRINNRPVREFRWIPTHLRDAAVAGACLTIERSSLPAFTYLWKNRVRLRAKRAEILGKHR